MIVPSIYICGSASSIPIRFLTHHHDDDSVNDCRSKEGKKTDLWWYRWNDVSTRACGCVDGYVQWCCPSRIEPVVQTQNFLVQYSLVELVSMKFIYSVYIYTYAFLTSVSIYVILIP